MDLRRGTIRLYQYLMIDKKTFDKENLRKNMPIFGWQEFLE
jgi:hypothetical protein